MGDPAIFSQKAQCFPPQNMPVFVENNAFAAAETAHFTILQGQAQFTMDPRIEILEKIRQEFEAAASPCDLSAEPRATVGPDNPFKKFALRHPNAWDKKLFIAKCSSYGFTAYRTPDDPLMVNRVNAPEKLYQEVFWPDFHSQVKNLAKLIEALVGEVLIEGGPWDHELEMPH